MGLLLLPYGSLATGYIHTTRRWVTEGGSDEEIRVSCSVRGLVSGGLSNKSLLRTVESVRWILYYMLRSLRRSRSEWI